MRATVMYGAGDVRIESVPDATLIQPTDAVLTIIRACICGSDLWPYKSMEPNEKGRVMGHEAIGAVEAVGSDVCTVKLGALVVMPFAWSDGRANSAARDCKRLVSTVASLAMKRFRVRKQRRCVSLSRTEPFTGCPSEKMMR